TPSSPPPLPLHASLPSSPPLYQQTPQFTASARSTSSEGRMNLLPGCRPMPLGKPPVASERLNRHRVLHLQYTIRAVDSGVQKRRSEEHTSELQSRVDLVC